MAVTKFEKPMGTEVQSLSEQIGNETSAIVTYNVGTISTGSAGFIGTKGNIYICNLQIMIDGTVSAGERDMATVSIAPKYNVTGAIIKNTDSSICGSFDILSNGKIYMNFTSAITTTSPSLFYLNGCGIAKS